MLDVTRFAKCLFAYLYRVYGRINSNDLPEGFPTSLFLRIPSHFVRSLGDCIATINRLLRPSLWALFDRAFVNESCNEDIFLKFVTRLCKILPADHLETLFLTMCAVVAELNLYFFRKDCFRFANYAPICLSTALKKSDKLLGTIVYDMDTFCTFRNDGVDGYRALVEYGNTVLDKIRANPNYVPEAVVEMSKTLFSIEVDPVESVVEPFVPQPSTSRCLPTYTVIKYSGSSASRTYMPASSASRGKICRICKDRNCVKFLDQFEIDFRVVY